MFIGSCEDTEDLEKLVDFRIATEQRSSTSHLSEDASDGPDVNSERVALTTKEDFRGTVPESDDLMGVGSDRDSDSSGKSEVGQFDGLGVDVDKQVLWLQITMDDTSLVTVMHSLEHLERWD